MIETTFQDDQEYDDGKESLDQDVFIRRLREPLPEKISMGRPMRQRRK